MPHSQIDEAMSLLTLHHVGCAVPSIEVALRPYTEGMGFSRVSQIVEIASQKVRVCFIETAPGVFIELVQGLAEDSPVSSFVKRRQYYYHVCYSTPNVARPLSNLRPTAFVGCHFSRLKPLATLTARSWSRPKWHSSNFALKVRCRCFRPPRTRWDVTGKPESVQTTRTLPGHREEFVAGRSLQSR